MAIAVMIYIYQNFLDTTSERRSPFIRLAIVTITSFSQSIVVGWDRQKGVQLHSLIYIYRGWHLVKKRM